ncbi:sugar ABC transporter substrate-binding protein [Paenibacillus sp. sgz5001063]|uniref:sugar ABC transporter substrate-binding protein n=1 Tax=Paenibacillus sp. sgz5001063 TaxID=3242474 RepID=UPI0036D40530
MSVSRVRIAAFSIMCLTVALFLSGCFPAGVVHTPQEKQAAATGRNEEQPLTFGIIYPMVNANYEWITEKAEVEARKHNVQLLVQAPDEANLEQQIRIMEMMIKRGVDGIAIAPVDSQALVGVINKAVDQGIPVVCFESDAPDSRRSAYIGADNRQTGIVIGQTVDHLLGGRGMILVESGMSHMLGFGERLQGLQTYLAEHTEIDILDIKHNDGSGDNAVLQLEQMISAHPHFSALVSLDFVSSSSSVLVWKAKGLKRYNIALGLTPSMMQAMDNGQITRVISQNEQNWGENLISTLLQKSQGITKTKWIDTKITIIGN